MAAWNVQSIPKIIHNENEKDMGSCSWKKKLKSQMSLRIRRRNGINLFKFKPYFYKFPE